MAKPDGYKKAIELLKSGLSKEEWLDFSIRWDSGDMTFEELMNQHLEVIAPEIFAGCATGMPEVCDVTEEA